GIGKRHGAGLGRRHEIDRSGEGGAQMLGRETGDAMDPGLTARQLRPVLFLALAERRNDSGAGDGDDGTTGVIGETGHAPAPSLVTTAMPSAAEKPSVTTPMDEGAEVASASKSVSSGGIVSPLESDKAARATASGNCASFM